MSFTFDKARRIVVDTQGIKKKEGRKKKKEKNQPRGESIAEKIGGRLRETLLKNIASARALAGVRISKARQACQFT